MRLYLIRHGQPEHVSGLCYGSSDVAVPAQEHARVLSDLTAKLPPGLPIYSSPLGRCSLLASALAQATAAPSLEHDARLAEMHFGAWELRAWEDIPRSEVDAWATDLAGYRPGGGESVVDVAQRVRAFRHAVTSSAGDAAIVVCHAGTIRLLLQCAPGATLHDIASRAAGAPHRIGYGELIVLDCQSGNH